MTRLLLCGFATLAVLAAQTPQFEVASIKPANRDDHSIDIHFQSGGRFVANGITVKVLIQQAFDIRNVQISGGPSWIESVPFDITARTEVTTISDTTDASLFTDDQRKIQMTTNRQRLQALLADRFQLRFHRETREQPVYALVVVKNGSRMKVSQNAPQGRDASMRRGRGRISGQHMSMALLAEGLTGALGRTVIDKTGLTGTYDINLEWTPDAVPTPGGTPDTAAPNDASRPSLFTALQEQLGLRVESEKGPVQQFVIDAVGKPSEN